MKTIIKELIIVLLLIIAILLVLGIFLYDYIPTNKVVPKIEQYQVPESIKEELKESVIDTEEETTPIVYEINDQDLNIYEKSKDYKKGKVNPFSATTQENSQTNGNTINNKTGNYNNTNTNSNSDNGYLPSNGTK